MFKLLKYDLRNNRYSGIKFMLFSLLFPYILFQWVPIPPDKSLTVMLVLQWVWAWVLMIRSCKTIYHHFAKDHIRLLPVRPSILLVSPILAFIVMFLISNILLIISFAFSSPEGFSSLYIPEMISETSLLFLGCLYALVIASFCMITAATLFRRKKTALPVGILLFILMYNGGNWIATAFEKFTPVSTVHFHHPLLQKLFGGDLSSAMDIAPLPYVIIVILVFSLLLYISRLGIKLEEE